MARISPRLWNHPCNDPGITRESEAMAFGIRLTGAGGAEHVRIAAITEAGRQEVARL